MINHPDNMAGFYKEDKEIYEFFKLNKGNEEKILKRELNFVAGQGYTADPPEAEAVWSDAVRHRRGQQSHIQYLL